VVSRRERSPLLRRYSWQVSGDLDHDAMRRAAALLRGTHDFGAFGRSPRPGGSTVRTVERIRVRRVRAFDGGPGAACVIEVSADAFLSGMMRSFTGALVAVGRGTMSVGEVAAMLEDPQCGRSITVAPARGLHQWMVTYPQTPASEPPA
jgi:tRNA pseudouridine38-40 synthase